MSPKKISFERSNCLKLKILVFGFQCKFNFSLWNRYQEQRRSEKKVHFSSCLFLIYYQKIKNSHVKMIWDHLTCLWGHRSLSGGHENSPVSPAVLRWDPPPCLQWRWASSSPENPPRDFHIQSQSCCWDSLNKHGDKHRRKSTIMTKILHSGSARWLPPLVFGHLRWEFLHLLLGSLLFMDGVAENWQE